MHILRSAPACVVTSLCLALLPGCGLFGRPSSVNLELQSEAKLNPNDSGESTTVYVRIYQLRDDQAFKDANYLGLWKDDAKVLGASLVGSRREVLLDASMTKPVELEVDKDTRFIGVMGLFNEEAGEKSWQQCVSLEEVEDLLFVVEGFKIIRKER